MGNESHKSASRPEKTEKGNLARSQIPFSYSNGAEGGTRTPTGFPTTPSRWRCLTVRCACTSFPFRTDPVQHTGRHHKSFLLHLRVRLHSQPDVGVSRRLLYCERTFGMVREVLFTPGLRSAVASSHKLALPVHLGERLTGLKRWNDGGIDGGPEAVRSQVLYPSELRARTLGKSSYCKGNPASTALLRNPLFTPEMGVVYAGFAFDSVLSPVIPIFLRYGPQLPDTVGPNLLTRPYTFEGQLHPSWSSLHFNPGDQGRAGIDPGFGSSLLPPGWAPPTASRRTGREQLPAPEQGVEYSSPLPPRRRIRRLGSGRYGGSERELFRMAEDRRRRFPEATVRAPSTGPASIPR